MYSAVAKFAFLGHRLNLVNWALNAFREGAAIFKFPSCIKKYQKLEKQIRHALTHGTMEFEEDDDDELFVD